MTWWIATGVPSARSCPRRCAAGVFRNGCSGDNGLAFNPTRRSFTGKLVDYLVDLGVKPITGRPDRPTTQGKNERFHQTLQKWLNARAPARTIAALQSLVDDFDPYLNHKRAHQALGGKTPAEAWAATEPCKTAFRSASRTPLVRRRRREQAAPQPRTGIPPSATALVGTSPTRVSTPAPARVAVCDDWSSPIGIT